MDSYKIYAAAFVIAGGLIIGCGDDEETTTTTESTSPSSSSAGGNGGEGGMTSSTTTTTTGGQGGGEVPPLPALGSTQIDRLGRPAVNTAANNTFTDGTTRSDAEDDYNQNADPSTWGASYAEDLAAGIAILDGLDTDCGNQPFSCGAAQTAGCYAALGGILSDDRLYVDSSASACSSYLAVEQAEPDDCGGRVPAYDVIATTYSLLAGVPFDDGVDAHAAAQIETFPYLQTP